MTADPVLSAAERDHADAQRAWDLHTRNVHASMGTCQECKRLAAHVDRTAAQVRLLAANPEPPPDQELF